MCCITCATLVGFFRRRLRCVRPGGVIAMIEPWVTPWSRFVYTRFHHEPFEPEATNLGVSVNRPSVWREWCVALDIVRTRSRSKFEREFPLWSIESIAPSMPFRYLVRGHLAAERDVGLEHGIVVLARRSMDPRSSRWPCRLHRLIAGRERSPWQLWATRAPVAGRRRRHNKREAMSMLPTSRHPPAGHLGLLGSAIVRSSTRGRPPAADGGESRPARFAGSGRGELLAPGQPA